MDSLDLHDVGENSLVDKHSFFSQLVFLLTGSAVI